MTQAISLTLISSYGDAVGKAGGIAKPAALLSPKISKKDVHIGVESCTVINHTSLQTTLRLMLLVSVDGEDKLISRELTIDNYAIGKEVSELIEETGAIHG